MRHLNESQHHLRVLLEPYDAKVSRTVFLEGKAPAMGLTYSTARETLTQVRRLPLGLGHVSSLSWLPPSLEVSSSNGILGNQ